MEAVNIPVHGGQHQVHLPIIVQVICQNSSVGHLSHINSVGAPCSSMRASFGFWKVWQQNRCTSYTSKSFLLWRSKAPIKPESIKQQVNEVWLQQKGLAAAAVGRQPTCDAVNHIEVAIVGGDHNVQALVLVHQTDKYRLQGRQINASTAVLCYEASSPSWLASLAH